MELEQLHSFTAPSILSLLYSHYFPKINFSCTVKLKQSNFYIFQCGKRIFLLQFKQKSSPVIH